MYLYLLYNESQSKHYIGITSNIERRVVEHNRINSSHYTGRTSGKWKLIGKIYFDNNNEARKEEKRLKKAKSKKYLLWFFSVDGRVRSSTGRAAPS